MKRPTIALSDRAGPERSLSSVSRRRFFGVTAAAAGVTLGSSLWTPARAEPGEGEPSPGAPDPIPHFFPGAHAHFFFPGHADGSASPTDPTGVHPNGRDPSTIFDFDGVIGEADLNLTGTGTDTTTNASAAYTFHTDMRFMTGKFVGTDGKIHHGSFAFI